LTLAEPWTTLAVMADDATPAMPPPLTEDEKALLRRVCRVRRITED
jgi:hypothetical protein